MGSKSLNMYNKNSFIFLAFACIAIVLIAGCTSQSSTTAAQTPAPAVSTLSPNEQSPLTTQVPATPEPTFTPANSPVVIATPSAAPAATPAPQDPIVGAWSLQGSQYSGTASIAADGTGKVVAGLLMVTKTITFTWQPTAPITDSAGNRYYTFALSDGTGDTATLYSNGTLMSPVLPAGTYLVKEG